MLVINKILEAIAEPMQFFKEYFSQAELADRSLIELPQELLKAWLHLIMSLVFWTAHWDRMEEHMATYFVLLNEGMNIVGRSLNRKSLL